VLWPPMVGTGPAAEPVPEPGGLIRASMPPVAGSRGGAEALQMLFRSPMIPLEPCAQTPISPPMSPIPGTEHTPPDGAMPVAGTAAVAGAPACATSPAFAGTWPDAGVAGLPAGRAAARGPAGRPRPPAPPPARRTARPAGRGPRRAAG